MKISQKGIELIKKYEGCRLSAYQCPAGIWTVGYGHTGGVYEGMKISQAQAEMYLKADLEKYEEYVKQYVSTPLTQGQFDALVSFTFNCGLGNLKTLVKGRTLGQIAEALLLYVKAGGNTLNGLIKRRNEERALFIGEGGESGDMRLTEYDRTLIKMGSRGEVVRLLQDFLADIGYTPGTADGIFGNNTKKAVIAFQNDAGLSADGIIGEKTWTALDEIRIFSGKEEGEEYMTANFKVKEFASKDGYGKVVLHIPMIRQLQKIRDHFGKPITINSGHRSRNHNKKVGGASNSFHVKGRAFDIVVKDTEPAAVARYAAEIGIKGIIRYDTFIHVDSRPARYWAMDKAGKKVPVNGF